MSPTPTLQSISCNNLTECSFTQPYFLTYLIQNPFMVIINVYDVNGYYICLLLLMQNHNLMMYLYVLDWNRWRTLVKLRIP